MDTSNLVCVPLVKELLNEENYKAWSVWIKNYLLGQDLWDVIEDLTEPSNPEDKLNAEYRVWRKKNAAALHAIQMSCGPEALSLIMDIPSAKLAWDALTNEYNSSPSSPSNSSVDTENQVSLQLYRPLYEAVYCGDWKAANDFLKEHPEGVTARIDDLGFTALHVAAEFGHLHIVEELVKLMSEQDLELKSHDGNTALSEVLPTGIIEMAECMVKKNKNILKIRNGKGDLPVVDAVFNAHLKMVRYIYSITPLEEFLLENRYQGAQLLMQCLLFSYLELALDLLERCPSLAITPDEDGDTAVLFLARVPSIFSSWHRFLFWQRWIYNWIQIPSASAVKDIRINITKSNARGCDDKMSKTLGMLHQLVEYIFNLIGVKRIYQIKLTHALSHELLRLTCDQIATLVTDSQLDEAHVHDSILDAAKNGIPEFITGVINANPIAQYAKDSLGMWLFFSAVRFRQAKVFSLIYGLVAKTRFLYEKDDNRNSLLHTAGMLESSSQLNRISGAALQMQRELQWFEEVKHITPPGFWEHRNKEGKTARELFTEHHKDLRKEGEDWMKQNATSCTVVAALIVTIMFAASSAVPGGNNQVTGYPIFQDHKLFKLFIVSDVISLFSSATSLLMFLGILTSRYTEDDFLKSLPTKLIIGLSMLFISIAAMMITFSAAISVMLPGRLWISIPVILFASVPVSLFVWLQFPLLVEIYGSTYGPSIFDRNTKPWLGDTHKI